LKNAIVLTLGIKPLIKPMKTPQKLGRPLRQLRMACFVWYFEGLGGCTIQYFNEAIIGYGTSMSYINTSFIDSWDK
jgi:hypothetical protein